MEKSNANQSRSLVLKLGFVVLAISLCALGVQAYQTIWAPYSAYEEPNVMGYLDKENPKSLTGGDNTHFHASSGEAFAQEIPNMGWGYSAAFDRGDGFFERPLQPAKPPGHLTDNDGLGPHYSATFCEGCHAADGRAKPPKNEHERIEEGFVRVSIPGKGPHGASLSPPGYGSQLSDQAVGGVKPEAHVRVKWLEVETGVLEGGEAYSLRKPEFLIKNLAYGPLPENTMYEMRLGPQVFGLGLLEAIKEEGKVVVQGANAWADLDARMARVLDLFAQIKEIEKTEIGTINYQLEHLRLKRRKLELDDKLDAQAKQKIALEEVQFEKSYQALQTNLDVLNQQIRRDSLVAKAANGQEIEIALEKVVLYYQPNAMNVLQKIGHYFAKVWEFLSEDPREANTEGGVFPAIFGTIMMVMIMAVIVTPFGVIAAVYMREYAKQGATTRIIRIAVNNLAGVPSIVYGVFGLGFFVYILGGNIDALFFPEALPAPTYGTPGMLWASLTLALLTLPVVIVSTEEGLSRIPSSIREGSLALGATKAETLWRTVLPMASPAMMTGLILAVARAAGEVAPLMLVGVVKLAPTLPLDGNFPFMHLDRKFMHLGFHIYDVGFQSPNVEAARPLVYATSLLLVMVIISLNLFAVGIRNHLREKFRALEN